MVAAVADSASKVRWEAALRCTETDRASSAGPIAAARRLGRSVVLTGLLVVLASCERDPGPPPDDEAKSAGATAEYFKPPPWVPDYFRETDARSAPQDAKSVASPDPLLDLDAKRQKREVTNVPLNEDSTKGPQEALGRNTWMMWCGGNEAFWDWLSNHSYGFMDFVKLIDSRKRIARWDDAGMVNEPGMRENHSPGRWGLYLDEPDNPGERAYREAVLDEAFRRIEAGSWNGAGGVPGAAEHAYWENYGISEEKYKEYGVVYDYSEAEYRKQYPKSGAQTASSPGSQAYPPASPEQSGYGKPKSGIHVPPAAVYGLSSGVIGLRLFPNPNFKGAARRDWNGERYYTDPSYYTNPELVRPFRVGMSCAFCHASMHPLRPPLDPARPEWRNISTTIGAQYLRTRAVVGNLLTPRSFIYHLLDSQPPGTIDTSLVASDNINNPNAMNAVFEIPARVVRSFENPVEKAGESAAAMPALWPTEQLPAVFEHLRKVLPQEFQSVVANLEKFKKLATNDAHRRTTRVLFDGSDSIGAATALARVYLNIGTYYEQWNRLHDPLAGFLAPETASREDRNARRNQLPFLIKDCNEHSTYWNATVQRVGPLRDFFIKLTDRMPLLDAEGDYPDKPRVDSSKLKRGREVFARNCICCHSSIQPESYFTVSDKPAEAAKFAEDHKAIAAERKEMIAKWQNWNPEKCDQNGPQEVWDHDPGRWLRNEKYIKWAVEVVEQPNFWRHNFLSTDFRVPVNYVGTNSGRALATNAMTGHMWQDFSSEWNRSLPSIGAIPYFNVVTGKDDTFVPVHRVTGNLPAGGGGPGFYRPASLVSIWSTAPYLHNNSLGLFNNDPSLKGRLEAFDDAIHKLLDPERRLQSSSFAPAGQLARDGGLVWRTTEDSWLELPGRSVPLLLQRTVGSNYLSQLSAKVEWLGPWRGLPTILALVIAFVLLIFKRGPSRGARLGRLLAYAVALAGLAFGFIAHFNSGGFGDFRLGPIPAGTPVNLLANIDAERDLGELKQAIGATIKGLAKIDARRLEGDQKKKVLREEIAPALLKVSKCPDFIMDKGHFFPWFRDLSAEDKEALIELIKTF